MVAAALQLVAIGPDPVAQEAVGFVVSAAVVYKTVALHCTVSNVVTHLLTARPAFAPVVVLAARVCKGQNRKEGKGGWGGATEAGITENLSPIISIYFIFTRPPPNLSTCKRRVCVPLCVCVCVCVLCVCVRMPEIFYNSELGIIKIENIKSEIYLI